MTAMESMDRIQADGKEETRCSFHLLKRQHRQQLLKCRPEAPLLAGSEGREERDREEMEVLQQLTKHVLCQGASQELQHWYPSISSFSLHHREPVASQQIPTLPQQCPLEQLHSREHLTSTSPGCQLAACHSSHPNRRPAEWGRLTVTCPITFFAVWKSQSDLIQSHCNLLESNLTRKANYRIHFKPHLIFQGQLYTF